MITTEHKKDDGYWLVRDGGQMVGRITQAEGRGFICLNFFTGNTFFVMTLAGAAREYQRIVDRAWRQSTLKSGSRGKRAS